MTYQSSVSLNFLPLIINDFKFKINRKTKDSNDLRPSQEIRFYSLPDDRNVWNNYWISHDSFNGFEEYICYSKLNPFITLFYLYNEIKKSIQQNFPDKLLPIEQSFKSKRIILKYKEYKIGTQTVWLEPYYLKSSNEFGLLVDFHFYSNRNDVPNIEELKLSLSLNNYNRPNTNFHQEKFDIINKIIESVISKIHIKSQHETIKISSSFRRISTSFLSVKEYVFGNNAKNNSQFNGLKQYSPFKVIQSNVKFFYVFKDNHIDLARDLVQALQGKTFKYTFPGFEKMFDFKMDKSNQLRVSIKDYGVSEIERIKDEIKKKHSGLALVIVLFPENESDFYYRLKNILLQNNIQSQAIHIETLRNKSGLKWSISSIALQIFSKSGGIPWRVVPSNENCLIIGVGKAHKRNSEGKIEKFYAYSVLIDSSGEYLEMNTLANEINESTYLDNLRLNLEKVIAEKSEYYSKITLHIPYKIKRNEIDKFLDVIKKFNESINFTVIKINDKSRFFGYNQDANSLIPFESTYIKISNNEFLVWSEGLNYNNKKANKRFSNPLYIEFIYPQNELLTEKQKTLYLQDILNLSGASWRGFNAKSMPISIFYPKIISGFIAEFHSRNLPEVEFEKLPPWFL